MKDIKVGKNKEKYFNILKRVLGIIALIVGLAGLIFPILPGWILIFVGLELLGIQILLVEKLKQYAKDQMKKMRKKQ